MYTRYGWIILKRFEDITGISAKAVHSRAKNPKFPEWREGGKLVKKMRDGHIYVHYEEYLAWLSDEVCG
jgi:hypothetical protein